MAMLNDQMVPNESKDLMMKHDETRHFCEVFEIAWKSWNEMKHDETISQTLALGNSRACGSCLAVRLYPVCLHVPIVLQ